MHAPSLVHLGVAKQLLRYIKGTANYGIWFKKKEQGQLMGYSDSDWAGSVDYMKRTSGYAFTLGSGLFSWNSKKQEVVAQSSAEAEYIVIASATNQALWLRKILYDSEQNGIEATVIKVDNKSAISMDKNPVLHGRNKHINVKFHTIRQAEKDGEVKLVHCSSNQQIADIMTKALPKWKFEFLRAKLGVSMKNLKEEFSKLTRRSRADILEQHLLDRNESMSVVLERFNNIGINTPRVVALLGAHRCGKTHCIKLVHHLHPEGDPQLNLEHVPHMLKKCPDPIPNPKAVQYVGNDRGTRMKLDNNYYRNILDNKELMLVDHQLAVDKKTRQYVKKIAKNEGYFFKEFARAITVLSENNPVKKMAKNEGCFFKEFARAITVLSENNPLTGTKGEIRKQCNLANKLH
ncbi:peroxidase 21-like [Lycium ferocissimum]|uniref:peroxidase 21-like n=1 Tax=Lycium ferocissimum TaxID=112874 RepID=UPI002815C3F3|nr:peroxidase 21-like [Lycium ferocissimum]